MEGISVAIIRLLSDSIYKKSNQHLKLSFLAFDIDRENQVFENVCNTHLRQQPKFFRKLAFYTTAQSSLYRSYTE